MIVCVQNIKQAETIAWKHDKKKSARTYRAGERTNRTNSVVRGDIVIGWQNLADMKHTLGCCDLISAQCIFHISGNCGFKTTTEMMAVMAARY